MGNFEKVEKNENKYLGILQMKEYFFSYHYLTVGIRVQ